MWVICQNMNASLSSSYVSQLLTYNLRWQRFIMSKNIFCLILWERQKPLIGKGEAWELHPLPASILIGNFVSYGVREVVETITTGDHIRCRSTTDIKCTVAEETTWSTTSMAWYRCCDGKVLQINCVGSGIKPDVLLAIQTFFCGL